MKRIVLSILAAAAIAGAAVPAAAQGTRPSDWIPLSQRQDNIAQRIDAGVASGALTDLAARDLRQQFQGLLNLEDEYRKTGLTLHQREDLQARYDTLSIRLRADTLTEGPVAYPAGGGQPVRGQPDAQ
jgi:hypothetical protein